MVQKNNTLESDVRCLYQLLKSKKNFNLPIEQGYGNCQECTPHNDNKKCKGYYPIKVHYYEIGDKND